MLTAIVIAALAVAPFSKGERVVFLGDSITRQGLYEGYVQLGVDTACPGLGVEVVNAGISGDTSSGALERFDWDLFLAACERQNRRANRLHALAEALGALAPPSVDARTPRSALRSLQKEKE